MIQAPVTFGVSAEFAQILTDFAGDLISVSEHPGEIAVLLKPLRGSLRADAGHTDQIVRSFSNQGGKVWVLLGVDSVFFEDRGVIHSRQIQDTLDRVKNGGRIADQLERIAVATNDVDPVAGCSSLICHGCD